MSLDAVILQEIKKLQNNQQGGSQLPPVGFVQKMPEQQDTISLLGAIFQKTGTLIQVPSSYGYPEELAYLMPKTQQVTPFTTQTFSAGHVACSNDIVVYTKSSSQASGQIYVGTSADNFTTFQVRDLPGSQQYYVYYERGVFFFLPTSGTTIVYSTDNLATFKTLSVSISSMRIVRSYVYQDGSIRFVIIPSGSSSNSNVAICQLSGEDLTYINYITIPATYLVDMAWDPESGRWFYVRQSGGPMYSTSLGQGLVSLVTNPASFSGITVSTSTVAVSNYPGQIQYFDRKIIIPLAGVSGGGFISIDPATLNAELMQGSTSNSSQRLWVSTSGKVLYTRINDAYGSLSRWVSQSKQASTSLSIPASNGFGSFSDKLGSWGTATPSDPSLFKEYYIYAGSIVREPNAYVRIN